MYARCSLTIARKQIWRASRSVKSTSAPNDYRIPEGSPASPTLILIRFRRGVNFEGRSAVSRANIIRYQSKPRDMSDPVEINHTLPSSWEAQFYEKFAERALKCPRLKNGASGRFRVSIRLLRRRQRMRARYWNVADAPQRGRLRLLWGIWKRNINRGETVTRSTYAGHSIFRSLRESCA